jgi:hypothetical protein
MSWEQGFKDALILSLLISLPLWHQWIQIHLSIASHQFLFYQCHLHLMTSYFINITCTSSLLISSISHASHHFLFHQHYLHLITSYFTPLCHQWTKRLLIIILLNGNENLWVLLRWNQFYPLSTDPRECYPCPTYFLNNTWYFNND